MASSKDAFVVNWDFLTLCMCVRKDYCTSDQLSIKQKKCRDQALNHLHSALRDHLKTNNLMIWSYSILKKELDTVMRGGWIADCGGWNDHGERQIFLDYTIRVHPVQYNKTKAVASIARGETTGSQRVGEHDGKYLLIFRWKKQLILLASSYLLHNTKQHLTLREGSDTSIVQYIWRKIVCEVVYGTGAEFCEALFLHGCAAKI